MFFIVSWGSQQGKGNYPSVAQLSEKSYIRFHLPSTDEKSGQIYYAIANTENNKYGKTFRLRGAIGSNIHAVSIGNDYVVIFYHKHSSSSPTKVQYRVGKKIGGKVVFTSERELPDNFKTLDSSLSAVYLPTQKYNLLFSYKLANKRGQRGYVKLAYIDSDGFIHFKDTNWRSTMIFANKNMNLDHIYMSLLPHNKIIVAVNQAYAKDRLFYYSVLQITSSNADPKIEIVEKNKYISNKHFDFTSDNDIFTLKGMIANNNNLDLLIHHFNYREGDHYYLNSTSCTFSQTSNSLKCSKYMSSMDTGLDDSDSFASASLAKVNDYAIVSWSRTNSYGPYSLHTQALKLNTVP